MHLLVHRIKLHCFFIFAFLFFSFNLYAQQAQLKINILNSKKEPVTFATVKLIPVADSSGAKEKISDSSGVALFNVVQGSLYIINVTSINYLPAQKGLTIKNPSSVFTITLASSENKLNAVVVTAAKPLMRQEDDKTIVDPENLAAASTNAYEIIEKIPGLFVDPDGNIYISSTTPATIYINGREQKMSAADIATMLKNLPPNAIASIEILRTPSAKYDASGSGGIVNVVLKKGVRIGLTGSVTTGFTQGRYGNQFVGFNLNNNNGGVTTYFNMQLGSRNSYDQLQTDRLFAADSLLSQTAFTKYKASNYYLGFGLTYGFHKKWTISYDGRISNTATNNNSDNLSLIKTVNSPQVIFSNRTNVNNKGTSFSIHNGINLSYKIDSLGSEWSTDVSYTFSPNKTNQFFNSGDGVIDNKLHFFSAQTNLQKKLPAKITVETGLKTTRVGFANNTGYFRITSGNRTKDDFRSRSFTYTENINSVFLQASKNFSGIILKIGTRMENTNMQGNQLVPGDTSFSIHRSDFFPYVYLSKALMKIAGYELRAYLVYRRSISRPAYEYLNPSLRFIDPFLYETGNPSLRPQFTKNYEANISVDEHPLFAVGLNDTKDIFTQVIYPADSSGKVSARTYDNLGSNKETYFRILGALPPGKRYFFVAGAQYNQNFYRGLYNNNPLLYKRGSWTIFTYQTFKITPLTMFSLSGFARFNGQQQFYELTSFGNLRMSLTQQFFKKKLHVTASVDDLLFTNNNNFTINQGSIHASGYRQSDTQRFGLNIRYSFGFRKKEENNFFNIVPPEVK